MYLRLTGLTKSFGGQEVLKNISFTLNKGEKVGLLGKNGCGKSTLFKIITGNEEPDSGSVIISPKDLKIGYLPQASSNDSKDNLSSGQKTKKLLEEILRGQPEVLLLDEPTNHLDFSGLVWLEETLLNYAGSILVVSHDRKFLDNIVDKIIELEKGKIEIYGGNYTFYRQQKKIMTEAQERKYGEQQKRITKLEEIVLTIKNKTRQLEKRTSGKDHYARRKAAKAAKSALSIEKRIAKEIAEAKIPKPDPVWELKALFAPKQESSQTVVQVRGVSKSFGEKKVLHDVSFLIQNKERIALIGNNGSGKTTLIKLILGQLSPDAGNISLGNRVQIGYLSQEHQELVGEGIVLDELIGQSVDKTEAYKLLRRFLLPPEKINQPVRFLSSGEKAKLLLAKIMASGANFIILDEPTNHLDIPSREAVEEALSSYPGTLLVVSHDRYFLEKINLDKLVFFEKGKIIETII